VKRNFFNGDKSLTNNLTKLLKINALISILLLSSCSSLSNRKSLFGSRTPPKKKAVMETVSKTQYDQLLNKYKVLMRTTGMGAEQEIQTDPLFKAKDPSEMVNQLSKVTDGPELVETVDVFKDKTAKGGAAYNKVLIGGSPALNYTEQEIEKQIKILRKASSLVNQNKHGRAVNLLKNLESSGIEQIRVHAKFLLGELLFQQGSYDLAMQIFEEIVKKYSFSGLIIKTLGRLIVCSDKLKLEKKRERYYSVLHDFFGTV